MNTKPITVVTGGASGIGAACVRHHVQRGDTVIVLDLASAWSDQKAHALGARPFASVMCSMISGCARLQI